MPIKKKNKELYPYNWRKISWYVIHVRAKEVCEGVTEDGECGAKNHQPHPVTGKNVVLSVAHLDHNPANCDESNMKAFCQRCHNRWDREHRNESIKETYREKHGEVIAEEAKQIFAEVKVIEKVPDIMSEKLEQLKVTLRAILKEIPPAEAMDYNVLLYSIELKTELMNIMMLPAEELNTLQMQTKITLLKQKQGLIEQMISVNKLAGAGMNKLREPGAVLPTPLKPDEIILPEQEEAQSFKGHGIKHIIKIRRNGKTIE